MKRETRKQEANTVLLIKIKHNVYYKLMCQKKNPQTITGDVTSFSFNTRGQRGAIDQTMGNYNGPNTCHPQIQILHKCL